MRTIATLLTLSPHLVNVGYSGIVCRNLAHMKQPTTACNGEHQEVCGDHNRPSALFLRRGPVVFRDRLINTSRDELRIGRSSRIF